MEIAAANPAGADAQPDFMRTRFGISKRLKPKRLADPVKHHWLA
jgi:hypothetical protein